MRKDYLQNPSLFPKYENIIKQMEKAEIKWVNGFRTEEMSDYLKKHGLRLIEDVGAAEYARSFGKGEKVSGTNCMMD